ncbi:MAG: hybrid sensor histidine kinase/response regulator [Candidatus Parcubacteria bacterium]|nr:hybrid sensor histidine kinase/response regulator [Leptolyngbyaceae cyanobacterium LF-bin-113]
MSHAKELEIRRQFLDEAQEYLQSLDAALMGLAGNRVDIQKLNAALRAAHSIKGGAGMMGFQVLSNLAHRLEDSFKVLKVDKEIVVTSYLENLLLSAVDCLHRVIESDRHDTPIDPDWLSTEVDPLFEQLHQQLGDPQDESAASLLSPEEGQDIIPLLFETEVEGCLHRLEGVLELPDQPCLHEELTILAQELGGLGEMLQLPAFSRLCESVVHYLEAGEYDAVTIAHAALQTWRQAQILAVNGQYEQIPMTITLQAAAVGLIANAQTHGSAEREPGEQEAVEAPDLPLDWEEAVLSSVAFAADPSTDDAYLDQPTVEPVQASVGKAPVSDFKVLEVQPDPDAPALDEDSDITVRVPVKQLNQLNDLFGELTIDRNGLDLYIKRIRNLTRLLQERAQALDQANSKMRTVYDKVTLSELGSPTLRSGLKLLTGSSNQESSSASHFKDSKFTKFDALEMDCYSDLHLLSQQVMEMIVQIQEVTEDIDLSLEDTEQVSRNLNKTAKQLQSGLTRLKMRPLSDIVDRFPRALRELSLQYGKQVQLKVFGKGTLTDRNILEMLNDPLMHLLRNAFDHGIEPPETRISKGKPAEGLIEIRASQQGNRTVITVRDDGEGIPIHKIRARAEQMGLDATLLAAASDEELLSLIFEPGFSTSDQVTTLSGRGVGMDVVQSNLKQIRGEVSVNTQAGIGTTFTLSIPFTLSTVRVLLVESHGMLLAFPTDIIQEMFLLKPEQVIQTVGAEIINWQSQAVQLVRLHRWLTFNCPLPPHGFETQPTIATASVIIVNQESQIFGIQIDRCWGEQETTVRRVDGTLPLPSGFNKCTIMGNGRVVPLVNVSELLRWIISCGRSSVKTSSTTAPSPLEVAPSTSRIAPTLPSSQPQTVLIVDDSINVRRFLALTLERAGYRVEQAKDGQEAWERLESGSNVQAVICDIEMPRLDGYGLLAKVKATSSLDRLPIAMLSSRSSDKHRQLAMSLGAIAYFTKPYNEQVLLQTLAQVMHLATAI